MTAFELIDATQYDYFALLTELEHAIAKRGEGSSANDNVARTKKHRLLRYVREGKKSPEFVLAAVAVDPLLASRWSTLPQDLAEARHAAAR